MIHYTLTVGGPDLVEDARPGLEVATKRYRVFDGDFFEAVSPEGTWAIAGISVADPIAGRRFSVDGDRLAVVNGPALAGIAPDDSLADHLLGQFVRGGSAAVSGCLGGSWNFVGRAPGGGVRAFTDFSGHSPLYWGERDGLTVIGNRSRVASEALGYGGWDLRALSWLCGQNVRGDAVPARGIRLLRPGIELHVPEGATQPEFSRSPEWIYSDPEAAERRENLTSAEWDDVTESLIANFRALGAIDFGMLLRLSGGKDSRLVLALALAAGLGDGLQTVTSGPHDSPEVECATEVARVAGVDHRRMGPPARPADEASAIQAPPSFDSPAVWRRLRQHAYRYEGLVSPWDGMNDRLKVTTMSFTGFGGEIYKRGADKRLHSADLVPSTFTSKVINALDPGGVRRPDIVEYQRRAVVDWVEESLDTSPFDSLAEKWFLDFRLPHWNGPMAQSKPGHIVLAPLSDSFAARKQLELTASARSDERLIYEVMSRVAPELTALPFMGDTWPQAIRDSSPLALAAEPFPATRKPTRFSLLSWQNEIVAQEGPKVIDLFEQAAAETDFGLVFDVDVLRHAVRTHDELKRPQFRQIISCIGAATSLLGASEQVVDHCT